MNRRVSLWLGAGALTIAAASFFVGYLDVQAQSPVVGTIAHLDGQAQRAVAKQWKTLRQGDSLRQGDHFKTLADSRLEAKLNDGSILRLGSSSELRLQTAQVSKKKKEKKVKARLVIGRVWAKVSRFLGGDSRFEVETANAVAGVRGTTFSANVNDGGDTTVKVYEGKVLVSNEPVYKVQGHTKQKRVQVAGPQEISKKQWNEMVAGAMQFIQVSANGTMSQPAGFELAAADDEWEAWNRQRDKLASKAAE